MKRAFLWLVLASALQASVLAGCDAVEPELRVRKTADGVGLFLNGRRIEPWLFSGRDGTRSKPVSSDWTRCEFVTRSETDRARCQFHLRCVFPEKEGTVRYRHFLMTTNGVEVGGFSRAFESDAALRERWKMWPTPEMTGWTNYVENGEWVQQVGPIGERKVRANYVPNSKYFDLKAGVEYRISFEVKSDVVNWIQPNMYAVGEGGRGYTQVMMETDDFFMGQVKLAAEAGVDIVSYLWQPSWIDENVYDFSELDAISDRTLRANPKALLVPRFGIDAPKRWLDRHPDAQMVFDGAGGPKAGYASPSSRLYREAACAYVRAIVRHMQERYPKSFAGLHICGQETHEWFYHQAHKRFNGYDPATAADFGGPAPTAAERSAHAPDGILLTGPSAPKVARFNRLLNEEMADLLVTVSKTAREATHGKKLVILFYGYTFELPSSGNSPGNVGHYALQRLLDGADGAIDMIAAPIPYGDRGWKGMSSTMGSVDTIVRAGVMPMDENDTRTHLDKVTPRRLSAPQETYDVLGRELAQGIFRNVGCWLFDVNGRDWFGDAKIWAKMSEARPLAKAVYAEGSPVAPDCALINDEHSLMWVSAKVNGFHFGWPFITEVRLMPAKAGLSSGHYLFSDVAREPVPAKLQLFLSAFGPTDADLAAVAEQRRTNPATRVWCWAPGLVDEDGRESLARMKTLTGFTFRRASEAVQAKEKYTPLFTVEEEPGVEVWSRWSDGTPRVAVRKDGAGYSVFMGLPDYKPATLRRLAKLAGVRLLLSDAEVGKFNAWSRGEHVLRQSVETGKVEVRSPPPASASGL